ncbi:hypothetical protein PHYBLDRAFT_65444 [Phycomyces blakesleeanus NRRL 1555(-)]|uniref:Uncharacterized protein n=1 Tax=Phycomyces blakesleeanus (strain ATCC 8743b / DSM 1359 / FGSC 10004 / NBRC 33097 / NRRL 1555) TaxID=763407 RepID=A0A167MDA7_PHYB8|nr:hypothetical protein PHYBLDRAFT_65444 [Phycomyces blakesleeanus NRRL 1555(-)]OAD72517.1 hypothetical protein PHYBLDRAFT_65444 [Phycomyces blakesleeanus NRRL 1555(-)]|eukprot:XP_018290557.1 hypothetical protein PHYBLDRAFT_65444 [Phycomyces blakesleeanus NRRL 1555(-)]
MKLSLFIACTLALLSVSVKADELQDQIDQAQKKFCGGVALSNPSQGQVFSDPTKVTVTVTRVPDAQAKVVYSIADNGQVNVDISKTAGVTLPSQFEFRVWVHNAAGPDCTLMSKVFKVTSPTHTNADTEAFDNLNVDVGRGCFGLDITKPELGEHVKAAPASLVQIGSDSASHVETYKQLELFKVNLDSREAVKVNDVWTGQENAHQLFTLKTDLSNVQSESNTAYYYKLTADTLHSETCSFYSHPFYIDSA